MLRDVTLQFHPTPVRRSDLLAPGTNGQQAMEELNVSSGLFALLKGQVSLLFHVKTPNQNAGCHPD
jgi:hypothetical protein